MLNMRSYGGGKEAPGQLSAWLVTHRAQDMCSLDVFHQCALFSERNCKIAHLTVTSPFALLLATAFASTPSLRSSSPGSV